MRSLRSGSASDLDGARRRRRGYFAVGFRHGSFMHSSALPVCMCRVNSVEDMAPVLATLCGPDYVPVPCDVGIAGTSARVLDLRQRACTKTPLAHSWITPTKYDWVVTRVLAMAGVSFQGLTAPLQFQELLRYDVGGHFGVHCDRQLGDTHLGTLLLALPSPDLVGGTLDMDCWDLSREDTAVAANAVPGTSSAAIFIPLGVRHSVCPVLAGYRLVLKASIFGSMRAPGQGYDPHQPVGHPRSD